MGQALYRKYRSKKFSEVIGQDHITRTLEKALKTGKINHAYLFTGPRGVGKTSVARILAHEVNKLEYSDDTIHLDIIEIDAASNRRIDEVRDLREKVHIAPAAAKYKVYIIDEVHMLTREAFNALLKTLEEPPAHCIFILATTEGHKLPETIVSRTQRFSFKPISQEDSKQHLGAIAKKEKIDIEPAALELLAQHSDGSFRDSISMLDQLSSYSSKVTETAVRQLLGIPPAESIASLVSAIEASDPSRVLQILAGLKEQGSTAALVARSLGVELRHKLISGSNDSSQLSRLLKSLVDVPASNSPDEMLEISLLEATALKQLPNNLKTTPEPTTIDRAKKQIVNKPKPASKSHTNKDFSLMQWDDVVLRIKAKAASLYTALRLATPEISNDELILKFQFPLHQKKVSKAENLRTIEDTIEEITGAKIRVVSSLQSDDRTQDDKQSNQPVGLAGFQTITNVFGSAEVLES